MSTFDVAVGINEKVINAALKHAHDSLYLKDQIFKGQEKGTSGGINYEIAWDIKKPPVVTLKKPEGSTAPNEFQMKIDPLHLHLKLANKSNPIFEDTPLPVEVVASVKVEGNQLFLEPKTATCELNPPDVDKQEFIDELLIPVALKTVKKLLTAIELPQISLGETVKFTYPAVLIENNSVIALSNLDGKSVPTPPFLNSWPTQDAFVMLSDDAKVKLGQAAANEMEKHHEIQGSFGESKVVLINYKAAIDIRNLTLTDKEAGDAKYNLSAELDGSIDLHSTLDQLKAILIALASSGSRSPEAEEASRTADGESGKPEGDGSTLEEKNLEAHATLYTDPNPTQGAIELFVNSQDNKVYADMTLEETTQIKFKDITGSPKSFIWFIEHSQEMLEAAATQLALHEIKEKGQDILVYEIKPFQVDFEEHDLHFELVLQKASLAPFNDMLTLGGGMTLSPNALKELGILSENSNQALQEKKISGTTLLFQPPLKEQNIDSNKEADQTFAHTFK